MAVPSITVTSTDIPSLGTIPAIHKGDLCGQPNISPHLAWLNVGFVTAHVEYWNVYVEDISTPGSGPNGGFLHWNVEQIWNYQLGITTNGAWANVPNLTIGATDYQSGDTPNGWNGPCPAANGTYVVTVQAKIWDNYAAYVFDGPSPDGTNIVTGAYRFQDYAGNLYPDIVTGQCGTPVCEPGAIYQPATGLCLQVQQAPAVYNGPPYTIVAGFQSGIWNQDGMNMYENIDGFNYPLVDLPFTGVFLDSGGTGVTVQLDVASPVSNVVWDSGGLTTQGRLNVAGIWSSPDVLGEFIGIGTCLNIPTTKEYCIGVSGFGTEWRVLVNGERVIIGKGHNTIYWNHHIFPITLSAGINIIQIEMTTPAPSTGNMVMEVYDATPAQLIAVPDVPTLNGYILFSTQSVIGQDYSIGQFAGYTCPDGYVYNACSTGECIKAEYVDPTIPQCCWRIENCKDAMEVYDIIMDPLETQAIYVNYIYEFSSNPIFTGKCFRVIGEVVNQAPDYINVEVATFHNTEACSVCNTALQFTSCEDAHVILVELAAGESTPVIGNIYDFGGTLVTDQQGCFTYNGEISGTPTYTDMTIGTDYSSSSCDACDTCHRFKSCRYEATAEGPEYIYVKNLNPSAGVDLSNLWTANSSIFLLSGDAALQIQDMCWKLLNEGPLGTPVLCPDPMVETVIDTVDVTEEQECDICEGCWQYFKLTNCADPTDITYMAWEYQETELPTQFAYVFDFAPTKCYSVEREYTPCTDELVAYNQSNIITLHTEGCDECETKCYTITNCLDDQDIYITPEQFVQYLDRVISWVDNDGNRYCGLVQEVVCRTAPAYPAFEGTVTDCFVNCEQCEESIADPADLPYPTNQRSPKPGFTVPDCVTETTTTTDCS